MKKIRRFICILLTLTVFVLGGIYVAQAQGNNEIMKDIEKKLIRFHVIANSDSAQDQALKLMVRDKVLEFIAPKLKECKNIEDSRKILKENDEQIKEIAQKIIKNNGFNYKVTTTLSKENFPVKTYGNITLPEGEYEAYRIIIGDGEGKNWWCVMFPPLCFIDITKGEVAYKQTQTEMKTVLSSKEYDFVDNTKDNSKIQIRFKLVDFIKGLTHKKSK